MTTYRDLWKANGKALVNGHVWQLNNINPRGTEVQLIRTVKVKAHLRRIGDYRGTGYRLIEIRRPIDAPATEATQ